MPRSSHLLTRGTLVYTRHPFLLPENPERNLYLRHVGTWSPASAWGLVFMGLEPVEPWDFSVCYI